MAQKTIDELFSKEKALERVSGLPRSYKLVLFSILAGEKNPILTSAVHKNYEQFCQSKNFKQLTKRRISGIISELSSMGLLQTKTISLGRYGRMRELLFEKKDIKDATKSYLKNELSI